MSRRRRPRFTALKSLWPWAAIVLLLAVSAGFFWMLGRGLRIERRPGLPAATPGPETAQAAKAAPK